MYRNVEFTREELFDMVWARPVLRLAREIGVSDVALSKACRKAAIPLPARGHWAIPEVRRPGKPKLPDAPPDRQGPVQFSVLDESHRDLPAHRPARDEPRIGVPEQLVEPHPLVASTLKALKRTKVQDGRAGPPIGGLDVATSPQQSDRALRVLDALIKACEERGYSWEIGEEGTRISCDGEKIRIRLRETLTRQAIPPPPRKAGTKGGWRHDEDSFYYPRHEWVSTGRLSFQVEDHVHNRARRNWSGTARTPLESKLHEVIAGLPLIAAGIRLARQEREAWHRKYEEEQARLEEKARQEEIQRRLRARLVRSLEQWERFGRLMAFCRAADHEISKLPEPERRGAEEWLSWATAHAEALNPFGDRTVESTCMAVDLTGWHHYGYQQPQPDWWTAPSRL